MRSGRMRFTAPGLFITIYLILFKILFGGLFIMSVSRYFGLPGCGKTTTLTMLAMKGLKDPRYKFVFCNVHLNVPGITYIEFDVLGKYELADCLVLIDEAAINCGDRDYQNFGKEKLKLFMEHRHHNMDIVLFSQEPDGVDKKIRSITDRMYYVKKGLLLGRWISTIYKIPYGLVWPSENSNGENLGKIVMGYKKPPLIASLFAKRVYRPLYYKYFDSWEVDRLPALPSKYRVTEKRISDLPFRYWYNKTIILLRWSKRYQRLKKLRSVRDKIENKINYSLTGTGGLNASN